MAALNAELWREIEEGDKRIEEALSGLLRRQQQLKQARSQATGAVAEIDRQLDRIHRILRAAGATPTPKPKKKKATKTKSVSAGTREQVLGYLAARPEQALTVDEVASGTGLHKTTVRGAMAVLRAEELVRIAGTRAALGGKANGRQPKQYRAKAPALQS